MHIHIITPAVSRVSGDISVTEGHDISHRVKDHLLASELPLEDVTVHVEPEEG